MSRSSVRSSRESPTSRAPLRPSAAHRPADRSARVHSFFSQRPWIADVLFFALPLTLITVSAMTSGGQFFFTESLLPVWVQLLVQLSMVIPLALRRTAPLLSSLIIAGACLLAVLTMLGPSITVLAVPITIYSTTKFGTAAHGRIVLGLGLFGSLMMGVYVYMISLQYSVGPNAYDVRPADYAVVVVLVGFCAAVALCAWLLGGIGYRQRREFAGIRERNRLLEQERASEARLAADAERMRIAREMHDVIAHSLSVVIVQADGGRYAARTDPEAAAQVLATIAETGRSALEQTRSLLGVLRAESGETPESTPLPGLEDLPALIEDFRAAGLDASFAEGSTSAAGSGDSTTASRADVAHSLSRKLAAPVQLAVYRILQESLTNVLKHAGTRARASVHLAHEDRHLVLTVTNDGLQGLPRTGEQAAPRLQLDHVSGGNGIIGMRERALLHGGELEAGPVHDAWRTETGFRVQARFPLPADIAAPAGITAEQTAETPGPASASTEQSAQAENAYGESNVEPAGSAEPAELSELPELPESARAREGSAAYGTDDLRSGRQ